MSFFNLEILNNNQLFVIRNTEQPPETEEILEKILYILQNKLEHSKKADDEYSLLSDKEIYEKLKKKATFLYKNRDQTSIKEKLVSAIYEKILPKEEIFDFLPTPLNEILFSYLGDTSPTLEVLKNESPSCQHYIEKCTLKKAQDIGYEGNNPVEAEHYLSVSSFAKESHTFKKYIIYKQEKIDLEATFKSLNSLNSDSFFPFFQDYPLYRPQHAFLLKKLFISFKEKIEKEGLSDAIQEKLATVFLMALNNNNQEVYEYCLSKNSEFIHTINKQEQNALIAAGQGGCLEIAKELIAKGFDVNKETSQDYTALFYAAMAGKTKMCQLLIEKGANLNVKESTAGQTVLMLTVNNHHEETIRLLIEKGIDIHAKSNWNRTALMYLFLDRDLENLKHHKNKDKDLFKIEEIENQTDKICKLLLEKEIDIHCKEKGPEGKNALMYAVKGRYYKATERLLMHGAKINTIDLSGRTALIFATDRQDNEIVQLLLTHKAEVNMQDSLGRTALILATKRQNKEIIQLLLTHKAEVNMQDSLGRTALILATKRQNKEIIQLLLTHRAEIDTPDSLGRTALRFAIEKQDKEIVQLLLTHNAKISVNTLDFAQQQGNQKIISLLEAHIKTLNSNPES